MTLDRREFLAASGALCIAVAVPGGRAGAAAATPIQLTAYVVIEPSGAVRVLSPVSEMGQGTFAAHAAIVADELGVAYEKVSVETASPADPYRRSAPGSSLPGQQSTGGSWGVRYWVAPLRKGAAQAREMLLAAAASRLGVPGADLELRDGVVVHGASERKLGIGSLAAAAAQLPPPAQPTLRTSESRRYVGTKLQRPDIPDKVRGRTLYSADFSRPGMLYACARLAPVHGARVLKIRKEGTLKVKGVLDVIALTHGAAVVAKTSWSAMQGARALELEFERTAQDTLDSDAISAAMREGLGASSKAIARNDGDFDATLKQAARVVTADYEVPHLNHAPLEPWSCTVEIAADGSVDVWGPIQAQDRARTGAAAALGIAAEKVRVHTLLLGGGFGRRLNDDGVGPAAIVARAVNKPVKFFWTRETEFAVGWGRPAHMARLIAALDAENRIIGVHVRTSGPSMRTHFSSPPAPPPDPATFVDGASVQNLADIRYRFGAYRIDYAMRHNHFPTGPWRAVGATQNAFFVEAFIDEVAAAVGKDPLQLRRELLSHDARALRVIDELAARSSWKSPLPDGVARGCAYFECYGSLCAQVAEVSLANGRPRVQRVVCVLDCGEVVTPDGARAQVEGGIVQGLSAALGEAHTLKNGAAVELNFDRYAVLRAPDAPRIIETHFISSGEALGGVGEPPLPPIAPAVANALRALTGKPVRRLPIAS